jgi:hypothetical protein
MRVERLFWVMFWRAKVKLWGSVSAFVSFLVTWINWIEGERNTGTGEAPGRVVCAADEGVDGACSCANIKADDGAGGVMGVGEGG